MCRRNMKEGGVEKVRRIDPEWEVQTVQFWIERNVHNLTLFRCIIIEAER
jgi:hypothetical protein